ncbi:sugar kinase [Phaeobacter sp. B1627]|uniref:sugar kinase n=1 Tax=Phaeobacter sp. B1627 TaxID=2583809 RepID=UPI001119CF89|nr:sugar kinase [Phaeobacter sp. B1627]TNJ44466.1 sugar kinase [Phaeobacter sp. B1627]
MSRIVAIGECMVEMASKDADTYRMGFAGDTMNTAWYLRRLLDQADTVEYFTAVGTDALSDRMVTFLQDAGLETDHILRRPDVSVGLYTIQLQEGERSFSYWRGQSAARSLAQDERALISVLTHADMAYFSGITLAILPENDRNTLLQVLADFRKKGAKVIFDPNLRPKLWEDEETMRRVVMEAASVSDMVLPSHEDEALWFGDADPAATAARYADHGSSWVIVKNGAGQILAWENGNLSLHDPVAVSEVIDTTAAGDSFNAGFIASWITGASVAGAIQSGAGLAAQVVQSRGALVNLR